MSEISSLTIGQKKIACSDTVLFKNRIELNSYDSDINLGSYNYDLSSYVTNEFDILGYFLCEHISNNSSVWSVCSLKDSSTNYQIQVSHVLNQFGYGYQRSFAWFPIPKNRIITKVIEGANCERCWLSLLGYQKLNSIELV